MYSILHATARQFPPPSTAPHGAVVSGWCLPELRPTNSTGPLRASRCLTKAGSLEAPRRPTVTPSGEAVVREGAVPAKHTGTQPNLT